MEYLVTMTTHVPDGTSDAAVQDMRTREAARSRELAAQGHLLRLWRPPLQPGEWRTLGLFAADDGAQLEKVLASMPLRIWRTDEVTPLSPHPNDPARQAEQRASSTPETGQRLPDRSPAPTDAHPRPLGGGTAAVAVATLGSCVTNCAGVPSGDPLRMRRDQDRVGLKSSRDVPFAVRQSESTGSNMTVDRRGRRRG